MKKFEYLVKVNNIWVSNYNSEKGGWKWDDVEELWQAMSEFDADSSPKIGLAVTEDNLADWEDCDGENIKDFLENTAKCGFIEDFDIEEVESDDEDD